MISAAGDFRTNGAESEIFLANVDGRFDADAGEMSFKPPVSPHPADLV